jgi:hypothetical protein
MKYGLVITLIIYFSFKSKAQSSFPDKCVGIWVGMMHIYKHGKLSDSVAIKMTIAKLTDSTWTWKTEYLSERMPMVKDYILKLKDKSKQVYYTDEGDGVVLQDHVYGNKMYSAFGYDDVLLTSTYEYLEEKLVFEVSSGKKTDFNHPNVTNYATSSLQRVILSKQKSPQ